MYIFYLFLNSFLISYSFLFLWSYIFFSAPCLSSSLTFHPIPLTLTLLIFSGDLVSFLCKSMYISLRVLLLLLLYFQFLMCKQFIVITCSLYYSLSPPYSCWSLSSTSLFSNVVSYFHNSLIMQSLYLCIFLLCLLLFVSNSIWYCKTKHI